MSRPGPEESNTAAAKKEIAKQMRRMPLKIYWEPTEEITHGKYLLATSSELDISGEHICVIFPESMAGALLEHCDDGKVLASFNAVMLPWGENQAFSYQLEPEDSIMLTPAMTGCTFVADLENKRPMVSHINFLNDKGTEDQAEVRRHIVEHHGAGVAVNPSRYLHISRKDVIADESGLTAEGTAVNVVGMTDSSGRWHFHTQRIADFELQSTKTVSQKAKKRSFLERLSPRRRAANTTSSIEASTPVSEVDADDTAAASPASTDSEHSGGASGGGGGDHDDDSTDESASRFTL